MALMSGPYTAAYGADLGRTETGYEILETHHHEDVRDDAAGEAPIDGIQRGTTVMVRCTCIDYDLFKVAVFKQNAEGGGIGNVGKTLTGLAASLVLTAVLATTSPATVTFPYAIVVNDVNLMLKSGLRKGPLTFRCYPDPSTGLAYTVTEPA